MPETISLPLTKVGVPAELHLSDLPHLAQKYLEHVFGLGAAPNLGPWSIAPFPRLNVTFRTRGQVRGSMSGSGLTVEEQLQDAVKKSALDTRFANRLVKGDLHRLSIEVWVQISSSIITMEQRNGREPFQWGVEGVEVRKGRHSAYYKPSVAITAKYASPADLFRALCKKAALPKDGWKDEECVVLRTAWRHFAMVDCSAAEEYVSLRPIHQLPPSIVTVKSWAESGARFLAFNQNADGNFTYLYDPLVNREKDASHNAVRSSGCAYSMAAAASSKELTISGERYESAERAIQAILKRKVNSSSGGSYIADASDKPQTGKLGTTALLLLALLCDGFRQAYSNEIDEFAKHIELAQGSDGLFACTTDKKERTGSQINFFPGQALLA